MKPHELIKRMIDKTLTEDVHIALPAKILTYNPQKMRAEVEILGKNVINNTEYTIPPIIDVPVSCFYAGGFIIRPPYKAGDVVQVLFNERAIDKLIISGEAENSVYKRKFSYDDAIIQQGIKIQAQTDLTSDNANDLLMMNIEQGSKIVIKANGDIELYNAGKLNLSADDIRLGSDGATEGVPLGTSLQTWLDAHTHSSGGSGPPSLPSPAPSSKVKVE